MAAFLLWFIIGSKGNWIFKAFMIFVYLYFALLVWSSIYSYLGWPSKDPFPPKYIVHWAQVEEPDPNSEGAIYIWLSELDSNDNFKLLKYYNKKNEPRIYQIQYTKPLHKSVQKMIEDIKKGSIYIGGEQKKEDAQRLGKDKNPLDGKGQFGFSHKSKDQYLFTLPPPKIPEKTR